MMRSWVRCLLLATAMLILCARLAESRGERRSKVHFRVHAADLVNAHTHTRTLSLPPGLYTTYTLPPHTQPVSYIKQTVYIPMRSTHPHLPMPGRLHHGFRPVVGPGAMLPMRLPVRLTMPAHHFHMHVPGVAPHHLTASLIMSRAPLHQVASAPQAPPLSPATPALIPLSVIDMRGPKQSAALRVAPPTHEKLKKAKGCRAFVKGHGEELADGDCFLEEYEKGYNEEQSKKTFYGDENSDVNTEKGGERQSRRYKNRHEYVRHPKVRHEWVMEAPRHLPRAQHPESQRMVAKPVILPGTGKPAKVALIRLPPGTAKLLVRPASASKEAKKETDDDGWDDDVPADHTNRVLSDEDPDINPVEQSNSAGLVEVFKQTARSVPTSQHVIRPIWMETYRPMKFKKGEDDDFDVEGSSSKPTRVAKLTAVVAETRVASQGSDDGEDDGWTTGFNEEEFSKGPRQASQKNEFDVDFEEEMKDIREDDSDDDDEDRKQAASANVQDSFAMVKRKGHAEKMLQRSRAGPLNTDHHQDSPRLSAILASGGHVFPPPTPPAQHAAAFGVKDPDRLEAGRKAPVVVEFGHELSGFKVTQEKEQKKWR